MTKQEKIKAVFELLRSESALAGMSDEQLWQAARDLVEIAGK